jgi:uncharacterized surface protein with fasciclin (FAS1) repeats
MFINEISYKTSKLLMMKFAKYITNKFLPAALIISALIAGCNKEPEDLGSIPTPTISSSKAIGDTLATSAEDSLFRKVIVRGGLLAMLNDKTKNFTVFAPNNAAIRAGVSVLSGGAIPPIGAPESVYVNFINTMLPVASAAGIVSYHILPQKVLTSSFSTSFPNFPYPTMLNPAPSVSSLLRLDVYLSQRTNGAWVNNIPVIVPNRLAGNGVIHSIPAVIVPPGALPGVPALLLDRVNTDPGLTYLKAAIQRADNGAPASNPSTIQYLLGSQSVAPAINLTLFAPTDDAMKAFLTGAIAQALIAQGIPAATALAAAQALVAGYGTTIISNPASIPTYGPQLAAVLTPATVKGLLAYHIMTSQIAPTSSTVPAYQPPGIRVFSVNIPTTAISAKTLVNAGGFGSTGFPNDPITMHPGVSLQAVFAPGLPVVASATVKGVANATPSNILINPNLNGSSDQHYVNGVLHKIDQVLLPQ